MLVLFTQSSGRGQFSLETMVTYGFALLFLITITAYAFSQQNYVNDYNAFVEAQDAAEDVASLINLASGTDSFRQPYYAPAVVGGDNYSINVSSNQVFLVFGNRTYLAIARAAEVQCGVCPLTGGNIYLVRRVNGGAIVVEAA